MALENYRQEESIYNEISLTEIVIKIKKWLFFLKVNSRFLFFTTLLSGIIGLIIPFFITTNYKATLTFALEEDKGSASSIAASGIASQIGFDFGSGATNLFSSSNILELMKSRMIIEKTLQTLVEFNNKKYLLAEIYLIVEGEFITKNKNIFSKEDFNKIDQRFKDSILHNISNQILKENLNLDQKDRKISIYTIEVLSKNELFSKLFAENLSKVTSEFYIETKSRKSKSNVDILEKQVDSLRKVLYDDIENVAYSTDKAYNSNPSLVIQTTSRSKKQIAVQSSSTILSQMIANLEIAKINLRKETPLIQIIDTPKPPLEIEKPSKLKYLIIFCILGFVISIFFIKLFEKLKNLNHKNL